ncbi:MaoC family dehydratase N-terminal domain-containing protein [Jhaorihella thermophila]
MGDGIIPDMGLPRRMWAGGRLAFHAPLLAGVPAERVSHLEQAVRKTGRSGPLAFVTLRHEISQGRRVCVTEWQDLVYREDPDPSAARPAPPEARRDETERRTVSFFDDSSVSLFGVDLQRAQNSLRPGLCTAGGGL